MKDEPLKIKELYHEWAGVEPDHMNYLPFSGSYRQYYRLISGETSTIGVYNDDLKENNAFFSFSATFRKFNLPVPSIHRTDSSGKVYLLDDLGDVTLYKFLSGKRKDDQNFPESLITTYKKVIRFLPVFQLVAGKEVDYSKCHPRPAFDRQSMMWDLNYFKYYFLKLAKVSFEEQKLEDDFETLVQYLSEAGADHFMYRDFQSRNIMLLEGEPWFIDYQGGRKGPLQYDMASLMYDAKASIPEAVRDYLLDFYLDELQKYPSVDITSFRKYYYGFVLIRILQALGAYGFRGYYENKPHFLKSIPYAIANLKYLLENKSIPVPLPMLRKVLDEIIGTPSFAAYEHPQNNLTIKISSFSYKSGIPGDESGNGGGFVFDCRALPNPGRFEEFRNVTGNDAEVIAFLEREHEVSEFLNHVFSLVDQSVKRYIERGFTSLVVNFGCTGGQHRSVYCANELAKHIQSKFNVKVVLEHSQLNRNSSDRES
jgi:aminoglycoside/choline kinase family phosphotransferase